MSPRLEQPGEGSERDIALGWLAFHRDGLRAKCVGLTGEQLVERNADPSHLSLLGLVRHLAEMEHVYGWLPWGEEPFGFVWGEYVDDADDDFDCTPADVEHSLAVWEREKALTDEALARVTDLDQVSSRNSYSLRWHLWKLVGEYARHNGHADLLRERIDGATGE